MISIQETLYLDLLASEAMGFVPMHFGLSRLVAGYANECDTLQLSPASEPKLPSQTHNVPNMPADCNRLDLFNLADNLEVHTSVYNMMQEASTHAFLPPCKQHGKPNNQASQKKRKTQLNHV